MIFAPDFERRITETARRHTDDIVQCDQADLDVMWVGGRPILRFIFRGLPGLSGRPYLGVGLVAESRKNPLAVGRLLEGDELRRHVIDSVEAYLKANGIEITRKVLG